jgi:filamentous hemagglutinin family protein
MSRNFRIRNEIPRHPHASRVPHPLAAGFRPAAAVLALAAAFALPQVALAQPVPRQVIHGAATFAGSGANLLVTTTNGSGTNHSAIDWRSFSVPQGSITQFLQPSAASTSINRVVEANPSSILGQLTSNGRLVLVNPWGITVGGGAVVDTAGFTASALAMSADDARAALLRFGGPGAALHVQSGAVIRGFGGDVVLIAPDVQVAQDAVVRSDGATLLLAGRKVEITGRGLEGIRMEVQAGDAAVNLGTLQGDAVGIFAGTLRHSGLVQAASASVQGGRVVLQASGDALVDGRISARAGERGGSIDVFGARVGLLAGAGVDASGPAGGGQVRIGGDYQGRNPEVPNAQRTYVDAGASIAADAGDQGDGGRVIVWADETTRMHGAISARGGAQGGNGGFAEVSGKKTLEFTGRADLRAPRGSRGTLLLDPNDIEIDDLVETTTLQDGSVFGAGPDTAILSTVDLNAQLAYSDVTVTTSASSSAIAPLGGRITVRDTAHIGWSSGSQLTLAADNGIVLAGHIVGQDLLTGAASGSLRLTTAAGDLVQLPGSVVRAGAVSATASAGNVQLEGSVSAGAGGVSLLADSGSISFGWIDASSFSGPAGAVTLRARGSIVGQSIDTTAGGGSNGGAITVSSRTGDIDLGALHADAGSGAEASGGTGGAITLDATAGVDASGKVLVGSGQVRVRDTVSSRGGDTSSYGAGEPRLVPILAGGGGRITITADGDVRIGARGVEGSWADIVADGGAAYGDTAPVAGGSGGTITLTSKAGKVDAYGLLQASGGSSSNGDGGAGGDVFITADAAVFATFTDVGGGSGGPGVGGSETVASTSGGVGGTGGNVTITLTGATGAVTSVGTVSATGGQGGDYYRSFTEALVDPNAPPTVPDGVAGAGGRGGTITIRGQALSVGDAAEFPTLDASGGAGGWSEVTNLVAAPGGPGQVLLTGTNLALGNVSLLGNAKAEATAGALHTLPGTLQDWQAGQGFHLDARDGIVLQGVLAAFGEPGSALSLHTAGGDITQPDGLVIASGLIAQADAGNVHLPQSNQILGVAGSAAGRFDVVSGFDFITVDTFGTPFAAARGISGNAGVSVRALGNIVTLAPIASGAGAVALTAGDAGVPPTDIAGELAWPAPAAPAPVTEMAIVSPVPVEPLPTDPPPAAISGGSVTVFGAISAATDITLRGAQGADSLAGGGAGVVLSADSVVHSEGEIQLVADRIDLLGTLVSGTRTVVRPLDAARRILVNGSDPTALNFTQAQIDRLGSTVVIGDASLTGGISIEAPTVIASGGTLSLVNGGAIGQKAGALLTTTHLQAEGASVVLEEVSIGSGTGGTVSGVARTGAFRIVNTQAVPAPLQVGRVDGRDGISAAGPVFIGTSGLLHLGTPVKSDAAGDAITLAAFDLARAAPGGLAAPNGRWLAYLADASANVATGPASGHLALWGRSFAANPPASIGEAGNRYVFARQPVVDVAAQGTTKVYDASSDFGALGFTAAGLVDASAFGNVFLQDVFTGALAVPTATRNVGSYGIERGTLQAPAGYRFGAYTPALASITPAPLTIAADNLGKVEGQSVVFSGTEFSAQGLVGGEKVDAVTLASAGAAAEAKPGAYAIRPSNPVGSNGFSSGNYAIAFLDGALAVFASAPPPPVVDPAKPAAVVQANNQVVTFTQLFVEEARTQPSIERPRARRKDEEGRARDDIVLTDTACKP